MHRIDNSKYLLFIEPKASEKLENPVDDQLTDLMKFALSKAIAGVSHYSDLNDNGKSLHSFNKNLGYKGFHSTECGECSSNKDYLLENGMITNSLCVYYLQYYRNSIPPTELLKLKMLQEYYNILK